MTGRPLLYSLLFISSTDQETSFRPMSAIMSHIAGTLFVLFPSPQIIQLLHIFPDVWSQNSNRAPEENLAVEEKDYRCHHFPSSSMAVFTHNKVCYSQLSSAWMFPNLHLCSCLILMFLLITADFFLCTKYATLL